MGVQGSLAFNYSFRHLLQRRTQAALTVGGIALVVFVFVATLMLAKGLEYTLATTGSPQNAIIIQSGAENEIQSGISRPNAAILTAQPEVERDAEGSAVVSEDVVVLVSLRKRDDGEPSNVTVRGVSKNALQVRRGVRVIAGRLPQPGTREVMVGRATNSKFAGTDIGQAVRIVGIDWAIVGVFEDGRSAFNSEIWGDADVLMPAFRREGFSSVTVRLSPGADFEALKQRLQSDRRFAVDVSRETDFYESQSRQLALFIRVLGMFVSVVFSLGAIIGAMITMYSSVSNRTREIGVLRALGFPRRNIFSAFVKECLLLGLAGGLCGVFAAFFLTFVSFATTNFNTFSDISFGFRMTPRIAVEGVVFALIMGMIGGAFPALRASRLNIVKALRSV